MTAVALPHNNTCLGDYENKFNCSLFNLASLALPSAGQGAWTQVAGASIEGKATDK